MSKAPVFPIAEPHHFSDYGFDPQLSYFQILEEAKRYTKRSLDSKPCLDSMHLKLQKPSIPKDLNSCSNSTLLNHKHRRTSTKKWLRSAGSALVFWKRTKKEQHSHTRSYSRAAYSASYPTCYSSSYSASTGPLYMTEDVSQTAIVTCRAKSGPVAADCAGPYFNLRELNQTGQSGNAITSAMPVYLVT